MELQIRPDVRSLPSPPKHNTSLDIQHVSESTPAKPDEYILESSAHLAPGTIRSWPYNEREAQEIEDSQVTPDKGNGYVEQLSERRTPTPPPRYDVQHQATCFFLNLFSFQADRLYNIPVLDFLPDMLSTSNDNSAIHQAARAVSRLTLADRYSGSDERLQTRREYVRALEVTHSAVRVTTEAVRDETVVAVWLLALYEAVNSVLSHKRTTPSQDPEFEWKSHISHLRGAMDLLRLRGKAQFTNPRSEKIYRVLKAAIQMRLFILNSVTSTDFKNLELDVYQDEHEFLPSDTARKASGYFLKAARLIEVMKYALRKRYEQPNSVTVARELQQHLEYGLSLDVTMTDWSKSEPGWDIMQIQAEKAGTMWALYPSHAVYYFYSFWVFLYWIRYLAARVKLYEALVEIVKSEPLVTLQGVSRRPSSTRRDFQIAQYTTIIQLTAAKLIGLTAYAIGDVTNRGTFHSSLSGQSPVRGWKECNAVAAMQLVIPLKVLQQSLYPTLAQKGAIDLAISHIGDGLRRQPVVE